MHVLAALWEFLLGSPVSSPSTDERGRPTGISKLSILDCVLQWIGTPSRVCPKLCPEFPWIVSRFPHNPVQDKRYGKWMDRFFFWLSAYGQYGNVWPLMSLPLQATVLSQAFFPTLAVLLIRHTVSSITVLTKSLINNHCTMWYGGKASVLLSKTQTPQRSRNVRHCLWANRPRSSFIAIHKLTHKFLIEICSCFRGRLLQLWDCY